MDLNLPDNSSFYTTKISDFALRYLSWLFRSSLRCEKRLRLPLFSVWTTEQRHEEHHRLVSMIINSYTLSYSGKYSLSRRQTILSTILTHIDSIVIPSAKPILHLPSIIPRHEPPVRDIVQFTHVAASLRDNG